LVSTVAVVATSDSQLSIYDTSGNLLDQVPLQESSQVVSLTPTLAIEDMVFGVLTNTSDVILYKCAIKDYSPDNTTQSSSIGVGIS
jgi:hypothetical protein